MRWRVSHVTSEEGEHGQRDAKAQSPAAQEFSELLNVELLRFRFQLMGMTYCGVDTSACCDDPVCGSLNDFKGIVAYRLDDKEWRQWRRHYAGLLVELGRGLVSTCAQPVENGDALDD
ncbi:hypothetical protein AA303_04100 [Pseudomonas psychrophila]|nr:hypothetical protein AA303_04100 [Pseudomonas psychrophila]